MLGVALVLLVVCSAVVYCECMITNFVGIQRDFTVVAGVKADVGIRVVDADGKAVDVGLCTWTFGIWKDGNAAKATHWGLLLDKPAGAQVSDLFWRLPVLQAGLWRYELTARGSDGEVSRVFFGMIGSREASDIVKDGARIGVQGWRMMEVQLPAVAGGKLVARWMSGDYVLALCEQARKHAETAERVQGEIEAVLDEAVEEATERAEGAAERAEVAAERAEVAADRADEALDDCQQFMAEWRVDIAGAVRPSFETGTWWVGDLNTGAPWRGQDGKSARISETGEWIEWNDAAGCWENTGVMAAGEDGFSPYINSFGNWVVKLNGEEVDSGVLASGKDGKDGASVKRIIVDSYNAIPQEGETCNGGHYYYTPLGIRDVTLTTATPSVILYAYGLDRVPEGKDLYINGEQFASVGQSLTEWVASLAGNAALSALVTMEALSDTELRISLQEGVDSVQLHLLTNGEMHKAGSNFGMTEGYEIWAWVERRRYNGINWVYEGSWVCVGEANDIATAEIYGLVKLGTDSVINAGAPVGKNVSGQMTVPIADTSAAGTAKLSTASSNLHESWRGAISKDASNKLWAQHATYGRHGVVKLSRADAMGRVISIGLVPDGTVVDGTDRGGSIGCTLSELDTYGVVKSQYHITNGVNGIEYVVPVGMRMDATTGNGNHSDPWYHGANGVLMFNLLSDGALHWQTSGTITRDGVEVSSGGYLELRTSSSFSQSITGLSLKEATSSLLGGVYKVTTLASGTSVPTCTAVLNYLSGNYYTKSQTYTRDELTRSGGVIEQELKEKLPIYAAKELQPYVKKADIEGLYAPASLSGTVSALGSKVDNNKAACDANMAEVLAAVQAMEKKLAGYVRTGDSGIEEISKVAYDDFAKLEALDENMLYLVTEG